MSDTNDSAPEAIPVEQPAAEQPTTKRRGGRRKAAEAPDTSFDPSQFDQQARQELQEEAAANAGLTDRPGGIDFEKLMKRGQAENLATARAAMESAQEPQHIGEAVDEVLEHAANGNGHVVRLNRKTQAFSKRTIPAGELAVHYLSKNDDLKAGVGVKVEFPGGRKPNSEEKDVIRRVMKGEGEQYPTGFNWDNKAEVWLKHFERPDEDLRDVPPARIAAIRADAENRVERLAEALQQHQADPVGYAEMVQQERAQPAQGRGA